MHRAGLGSDSQWRFSDKILNLSSTDSDEGNEAWPRPPLNHPRRQLRPSARFRRKRFSAGSYQEGEDLPDNESTIQLKFEDTGQRDRTKNRRTENFQQHILGLQQQSLQLLEQAFDEIQDLRMQLSDLVVAIRQRDALLEALSASIAACQFSLSETQNHRVELPNCIPVPTSHPTRPVIRASDNATKSSIHGQVETRNYILTFPRHPPTKHVNKTLDDRPRFSVRDLIQVRKRFSFANMSSNIDPEVKSDLIDFIKSECRSQQRKDQPECRDHIVSRLDSDRLEALRLPVRSMGISIRNKS